MLLTIPFHTLLQAFEGVWKSWISRSLPCCIAPYSTLSLGPPPMFLCCPGILLIFTSIFFFFAVPLPVLFPLSVSSPPFLGFLSLSLLCSFSSCHLSLFLSQLHPYLLSPCSICPPAYPSLLPPLNPLVHQNLTNCGYGGSPGSFLPYHRVMTPCWGSWIQVATTLEHSLASGDAKGPLSITI